MLTMGGAIAIVLDYKYDHAVDGIITLGRRK